MTPPPPRPARPSPDPDSQGSELIVLAIVAGAHGVGGEVKLKLFTDDLSPYRSFNNGALTLTALRGNIARFAQIADRTAAEALRGTPLSVARTELPALADGEFYHADLIGLPAVSSDGEELGRVVAVENFGGGDILEIERPTGKRFMVPIIAAEIGDRAVIDAAFVD